MSGKVSIATSSFANFLGLAGHGKLHLRRDRIGAEYVIKNASYKIFRETTKPDTHGAPIILVIGFRLKLIKSFSLLHWLFQRVCIITTPFWCGLKGFKTKLWMVDPTTKNYLGIYDWRGEKDAKTYLNFLLPILNFFSVKDTVWANQISDKNFEDYLAKHQ